MKATIKPVGQRTALHHVDGFSAQSATQQGISAQSATQSSMFRRNGAQALHSHRCSGRLGFIGASLEFIGNRHRPALAKSIFLWECLPGRIESSAPRCVVSLLFRCCVVVVSLLFRCCFVVVALLFRCCFFEVSRDNFGMSSKFPEITSGCL